MKSHTFVPDGTYYLHRAFNVALQKRDPQHWRKNVLNMFLSMIGNDARDLKATHVLVTFDGPETFRTKIFKGYKGTRTKKDHTEIELRGGGGSYVVEGTPGELMKPARKLLKACGLTSTQKGDLESDDLQAGAAVSLPGRVTLGTRDKDLAACVNDRVFQWWPTEKKLFGPKEVFKKYGIHPHQMRDYLCLLGDKVDNIPGTPGVGEITAVKWLAEFGSIQNALKDPKVGAFLRKHSDQLVLARKLVTLDTSATFELSALVPQPIDPNAVDLVWKIPNSIRNLSDARKALSLKGLFS